MTISIDPITGDDVITLADMQGGVTLTGTTSADVLLRIYDSTGLVSATLIVAQGNTWSATFPSFVNDGTCLVEAEASDGSGTFTRTVVVDRIQPVVSSITISDTELGPGETALVTFQFSEAVTGFTAQDVSAGLGSISNVTAVDADTYTAIFTPGLGNQGHGTIRVSSSSSGGGVAWTDIAGNQPLNWPGDAAESEPYLVDTLPPMPGTLAFANLTDSGSDDAPDITTDNVFDLILTGQEAGAAITYEISSDNGATWSATTAGQSGLADGTYRFRASVADVAGNTSATSELTVTVDRVAIPGTLAFAGLVDTGSDDASDITTDNVFALALSGQEAGAAIAYEVSTDGGASWTTTAASQSALADATYRFRTRVTDAAGNSGIGNLIEMTVDHRAPAAGLLAFANLAGLSGGTTSDDTFDLVTSGHEVGAGVAYQVSTDGGTTWLTTAAAQSGLAGGNYQFRAFVVDAAGNIAGTNELAITVSRDNAPGLPPVNTVPATLAIEANHSLAISGLAIDDGDAGVGIMTTIVSVAHGTLTVASAGGAMVSGSGTASATLTGTLAEINTTLAATANITYTPTHDFFGLDTLTVLTNDGLFTDTDAVPIQVNTLLTGTPGDDSFAAPAGNARIDALGGDDAIALGFRLVDATVRHAGNAVIIDGPNGSHAVLTGFETFVFTDGTVDNSDGSPLIDDLFYYSHHHGVWTAHLDADTHFNTAGWKQGFDPSAFFDTSIYLSANPDVAASGNPLTHYDAIGWQQGRVPSLAFDGRAYLDANPDVKAASIDPLFHFLAFGASEGRAPIKPTELVTANGFDFVYYLANNPDVAAAGVDPFWHFQNIGWTEGRNPNAYFDTAGYLSTYTDVAAAHINPLDHYNASGWHEGRDPSPGFDTASYLSDNPDVAAAHVNPLVHFLQSGHYEGRSAIADGVWG